MALVSADISAEIKNITLDSLVRTPLRQAAGTLGASVLTPLDNETEIWKP
jgi:hypothetical protein